MMSTIIDDFLYLGSLRDACTPQTLNELQITHCINLTVTKVILDSSFELLHIPLHDTLNENIKKYFQQTNQFIENCHKQNNGRCLVFCKHGRSRSPAMIAYLIEHHGHSLSSAYYFLLNIRPTISPNRNYFDQLDEYSSRLEQSRSPVIY